MNNYKRIMATITISEYHCLLTAEGPGGSRTTYWLLGYRLLTTGPQAKDLRLLTTRF